jgi:sugar O-acyltransferase (sialic acid O-acetyltransferase NeuD family)
MAPRDFIIWGSKGHGLVLAELIRLIGDRVVALVDNDPQASAIMPDTPLYIGHDGFRTAVARHASAELHGVAAVGGGRGADRQAIHHAFTTAGIAVIALIHPRAHVCASARIGAGSHVMAGATIAAEARIGPDCIVNHGAVVEHECVLSAGVHVGPGATLCGCVSAGDNAFVGAGAVVLPRLRLGEGCTVGAGAVVTRHVTPGAIVAGNPARPRDGA